MSYVKHRPTVFDEFPMDVIRYHLFPFLDLDARIAMNQCLPRWDRVSRKFDAALLKKHQKDICVSMVNGYLCSIEDMPSGDKKLKKMKKMLKLLQTPIYLSFMNDQPKFRAAVVNKATEMRTAATYYGTRGSLEYKVALINQAKRLLSALKA